MRVPLDAGAASSGKPRAVAWVMQWVISRAACNPIEPARNAYSPTITATGRPSRRPSPTTTASSVPARVRADASSAA